MKTQVPADNSNMPRSDEMTDEALALQARQLRLQALQGSAWAAALASRYEVELRNRLNRTAFDAFDPSDMSADSECSTMPTGEKKIQGVPPVKTRATISSDNLIGTADETADPVTQAISTLLGNLRELLEMDIALVAEFLDGRRVFRHVDVDPSQASRLQVGQSMPLEDTYCQRVIDGRLPPVMADTSAFPEAQGLVATQKLGIGAYLSTPVVLSSGEVYGTLCCISHQARSVLGCRQVDALRSVAALVSAEIEKSRRAFSRH